MPNIFVLSYAFREHNRFIFSPADSYTTVSEQLTFKFIFGII